MSHPDGPAVPTLFEWAGGPDPLRRMIDCFYDRVEADDELAGFFPGGVTVHHREHVADWWAEVLGGPETYTERHGGYEPMLRHHRGRAITPAQRHRFATTMSLAVDDRRVPCGKLSGAPGWPWRTPSPTPPPSSTHPPLGGAGASPRPTWGSPGRPCPPTTKAE